MKHIWWLIILGTCAMLLSGCGGGQNSLVTGTTGSATLTIRWPARTARFIPAATTGVEIAIYRPSDLQTPISTRWVERPAGGGGTSSTTFNLLPAGTLQVTATAMAEVTEPEWNRYVLASGTAPLVITAAQVTPITLTMASTIATLSTSDSLVRVLMGKTKSITLTALDAGNNPVLLSADKIVWEMSAPGIVSITPDPALPFVYTVTPLAVGSVTLTARDTETNMQTAAVTVQTAEGAFVPSAADLVGTWTFIDDTTLVVTQGATGLEFDLNPITFEPGFAISNADVNATLVNGVFTGTYSTWDATGTVETTGAATLKFTWADDGSLTLEASGADPFGPYYCIDGTKNP